MRQKRAAEEQVEEFRVRINELQTINVNLTSVKSKLEQELGNLTADYDEVTKELKVSGRRGVGVGVGVGDASGGLEVGDVVVMSCGTWINMDFISVASHPNHRVKTWSQRCHAWQRIVISYCMAC